MFCQSTQVHRSAPLPAKRGNSHIRKTTPKVLGGGAPSTPTSAKRSHKRAATSPISFESSVVESTLKLAATWSDPLQASWKKGPASGRNQFSLGQHQSQPGRSQTIFGRRRPGTSPKSCRRWPKLDRIHPGASKTQSSWANSTNPIRPKPSQYWQKPPPQMAESIHSSIHSFILGRTLPKVTCRAERTDAKRTR